MPNISDISKGVVIRWSGDLMLVVEFQHVNPGKGSSFSRVRMKNIVSGKVIEQTFKSGDTIEFADVQRPKMQFLYQDPSGFSFMDQQSFEQVVVPRDLIGEDAYYLTEGAEMHLVMHEGQPVSLELPKKVTLTVTEAFSVERGDTASGNVTKEVTLETGMTIRVPLFVKQGDQIVVNTDNGSYVERA
jgi:elongation factor P